MGLNKNNPDPNQLENVHLTKRMSGAIFLLFSLILAIVSIQSGTLIALFVPILFLLFISRQYIEVKPLGPVLTVERDLSRLRIIEGDDIDISLKIHNISKYQTHIIELEDHLFPEFEVTKGSNIFMFSLSPNEQIILKYSVKCHQFGKYRFDTITVRHRDFLGITINEFSLDSNSMPLLSHKIAVIPKIEKIETLPVITDWLRLYSGFWNSQYLGNDTDFRGIREFTYGDSLRNINWKTTARYQTSTKHPQLISDVKETLKALDVIKILKEKRKDEELEESKDNSNNSK